MRDQIHKSAVSLCKPVGPLGTMIVVPREDAAPTHQFTAPPGQFADANVYLGDYVFGAGGRVGVGRLLAQCAKQRRKGFRL